MQIIEAKNIPFRNTLGASSLRCMVCKFHLAEIHLVIIHGPVNAKVPVCPKCANIEASVLETIIFPESKQQAEPESVPAMVAGF